MRCGWRRGRGRRPEARASVSVARPRPARLAWRGAINRGGRDAADDDAGGTGGSGSLRRVVQLTAGASGAGGPHRLALRVYYEDTDLAGIVYYANYLKFIERGRSEWVRACGLDQVRLREEQGLVFAVRRVEADYLRPARFDDLLEVETRLIRLGGARIELQQAVLRGGERLFEAVVVLVAMTVAGAAVRLPEAVRQRLSAEG